MKTQKVSVDVWAMLQTMLGYLALAILGGIFIRLLVTVITLPKRLRQQKDSVHKAMEELRSKYPEAFKEVDDELMEKENEENADGKECPDDKGDTKGKKIN